MAIIAAAMHQVKGVPICIPVLNLQIFSSTAIIRFPWVMGLITLAFVQTIRDMYGPSRLSWPWVNHLMGQLYHIMSGKQNYRVIALVFTHFLQWHKWSYSKQ